MTSLTLEQPHCAAREPLSVFAGLPKYELFGLWVAASDYGEIVDLVVQAARKHCPAILSFHAVHAVIESIRDPDLLKQVNRFKREAPALAPVPMKDCPMCTVSIPAGAKRCPQCTSDLGLTGVRA